MNVDHHNPYASPAPPPTFGSLPPIVQPTGELLPASMGLRFANYFLDSIFTSIVSQGGGFVIGMGYALSRPNPAQPITPDENFLLTIIGMVFGLSVMLLYFIVMEAMWQRTLAKFITGTRVVDANGGTPTFGQIVGRTFARLIPFEPFSFLSGGNPVGWHDSLSGTRVVKVQ